MAGRHRLEKSPRRGMVALAVLASLPALLGTATAGALEAVPAESAPPVTYEAPAPATSDPVIVPADLEVTTPHIEATAIPAKSAVAPFPAPELVEVSSLPRYPNGRLPDEALCQIPFAPSMPGLDCSAVDALVELNEAYRDHFGRDLHFTDTYRTYEQQVDCYHNPAKILADGTHMCAVPGTSNHGTGRAIDFAGGIEDPHSPQHTWMDENAHRFGWVNPDWAKYDKFEPWHWEYGVSH